MKIISTSALPLFGVVHCILPDKIVFIGLIKFFCQDGEAFTFLCSIEADVERIRGELRSLTIEKTEMPRLLKAELEENFNRLLCVNVSENFTLYKDSLLLWMQRLKKVADNLFEVSQNVCIYFPLLYLFISRWKAVQKMCMILNLNPLWR